MRRRREPDLSLDVRAGADRLQQPVRALARNRRRRRSSTLRSRSARPPAVSDPSSGSPARSSTLPTGGCRPVRTSRPTSGRRCAESPRPGVSTTSSDSASTWWVRTRFRGARSVAPSRSGSTGARRVRCRSIRPGRARRWTCRWSDLLRRHLPAPGRFTVRDLAFRSARVQRHTQGRVALVCRCPGVSDRSARRPSQPCRRRLKPARRRFAGEPRAGDADRRPRHHHLVHGLHRNRRRPRPHATRPGPRPRCTGAPTRERLNRIAGGPSDDTPYHYVELTGLEPGPDLLLPGPLEREAGAADAVHPDQRQRGRHLRLRARAPAAVQLHDPAAAAGPVPVLDRAVQRPAHGRDDSRAASAASRRSPASNRCPACRRIPR